jgi:uncharacterized cofD-like protein
MKKNIVCFGGGNAMPKAILLELKSYPVHITSITSMVDNGGSTGQLRREFNILPPGDIRRHLLALSEAPIWKKELWKFRFGNEVFYGGHKGHNFANIFIGGLEYTIKDYSKVLEIVHKFLEIKGHQALPATIKQTQLAALLENGKIVFGEDEIDVPKNRDSNLRIEKIYLRPQVKAYPPVLEALKKADLITIGPGDLYSSSLPCLLPGGISSAIKKSKAKKVFICNTMTKMGETNNFSVLDFSNEAEKYLGCNLNFVIYNRQMLSSRRVEKHKRENAFAGEMVKVDKGLDKDKFIGTEILEKKGPAIYNSKRLVKLLRSLI